MTSLLDRAELVSRILSELEAQVSEPLVSAFARAVLRRVDDTYLFRHRLTTLSAQLSDSFRWVGPAILGGDIAVRVFRPTAEVNGYALDGLVIETVMPDQSFIYDTTKLALEQRGVRVLNNLRVVLPVTIDEASRTLSAVGENTATAGMFGYTRWYVTFDGASDATCEALRGDIIDRLVLVRALVQDFHRMTHEVRAIGNEFEYLTKVPQSPRAACLEVKDFLTWLTEDDFVFMGLSVFQRDASGALLSAPERSLGIARHPTAPVVEAADLAFLADPRGLEGPLARVRKSDADSRLHRRGKIDAIAVRTFDAAGKPTGGVVLQGMFTFKGLSQPGGDIPILRAKLTHILEAEGMREGDYDQKSLVAAFNALPVEYLCEADVDTIRALLAMTREAYDQHEFKSHLALSPDGRSAYAFIVLPKENYSDELRASLQRTIQRELAANYSDHRVHLSEYGSAAIHIYLTSDRALGGGKVDLDALKARLAEIGTPWSRRLRAALERDLGETAGAEKHARYSAFLPESYTEQTPVDLAVVDIGHLEEVIASGAPRFDIVAANGSADDALLRIYSPKALLLTDILPVVDNFGIVVAEQNAWEIAPQHASTKLQINTLRVRRGDPDLLPQRAELVEGLAAVFGQKMRSDRINRLLLRARITWREVEVFRAYYSYSRQLGVALTPEVVQKVLIHHATFVSHLTELFRVRFDPGAAASMEYRQAQEQRLGARLESYLSGVASFDEDRILRLFMKLVRATVRTNFYRPRQNPALPYYTSFKFDCALVPDMPNPRPLFEIWVHATDVEGVHLRGGKVARGGLRWSDRLNDFRSEILGLMATQQLKNAVIVPVGAKGGFVLKSPPEDWAEARARADFYYQVFISGLLDVTDNIDDGAVVAPPNVVCHDPADPYLVVAADKGTAHLSDTANRLSKAYGFWLSDAFASGGSIGYDHKDKGITAKGAWVCVRRQFYELGIDPNTDPITVVGIGDMSGDVFGNGLLLSKTVRLIGAFDHRHIFLDPNPGDSLVAWTERKRLFEKKGSKWSDYDPDLISAGGGVFERGAKSIALWPDVQKRLGTDRAEVSGEELVKLMLKAEVDLLWNGGIGTYVKASTETHADAKDPANDRVRVDASELRCHVIGEGGNLGMTQRARNEFAELGGQVYMDAIDNSGGVDLSDHEVNIKTLLHHPLSSGALSSEARNALIIEVGDEVCDLVLNDNEGQARAISLDAVRSRRDIWSFHHAMMWLREQVGFSRYGEHLPANPDVIGKRKDQGRGFLKPELSKLLLYSKMALFKGLVTNPPGSRAERLPFLKAYFPAEIVARHSDALEKHFLFDEIAGTVVTNRIIEWAGVNLVPALQIATERAPAEIAAGYLLAEEALRAQSLRASIQAAKLPAEPTYQALLRIEDALLSLTRSILWTSVDRVTIGMRPSALFETLEQLTDTGLLPERARRQKRDEAKAFEALGFDESLAQQLGRLGVLVHAPWVARLAASAKAELRAAAGAYFAGGYATNLLDLGAALERQDWPDRWDHIAVGPLQRQLLDLGVTLGAKVLEKGDDALKHASLTAFSGQVDELLKQRIPLSALIVLAERLRQRLLAV
jgi:glutamate dehydrogenase